MRVSASADFKDSQVARVASFGGKVKVSDDGVGERVRRFAKVYRGREAEMAELSTIDPASETHCEP